MTHTTNPCATCGEPIAEGARFCPHCGAAQSRPPAPQPEEPPLDQPPDLSYGNYRQLLFRVAHNVRRLRDIAQSSQSAEEQPLDDLLRLIEASHFSIAVVGEFKRGKSTFINALLGDEILPADIEPCSATLNRVTYGLKPSARVVFRAEVPGREERVEAIPIERLADYVTKLTPESETMSALVKEAVIAYPVPFCKNNVDIIDTPGLNDDPVMTEVTFHVLSTVHAAIMVVMANAPFGESESSFLREVLLKEHTSVMFVVTAIDRIRREADRERVLQSIKSRITQAIKQYAVERFGEGTAEQTSYLARIGDPMIFGLSGYQALQARRENNVEQLSSSGFPEFEQALEQFLTRERGARSLADMIARVLLSGEKLRTQLDESRDRRVAQLHRGVSEVQAAHGRHAELRTRSGGVLAQISGSQTVEPMVVGAAARFEALEMELKIAVGRVVEQAIISPEELSAALKETIGDAVGNTGQKLLDKLPPGQAQDVGKRYMDKAAGWIKGPGAKPEPGTHQTLAAIGLPGQGLARHRLTETLPGEVNAALAQVWKSLTGTCHMEIQRGLQSAYEQLRALAVEIGQNLEQTAGQFSMVSPGAELGQQFDQLLLGLPPESGIWAASDGERVRLGPTLPGLKAAIQKAAGAVHAKVGVLMLRSPNVDQFKSQLIRATAEQITQHVRPQQVELRQALGTDVSTSVHALAGTAYQLFEANFAQQEALLSEIRRTQDRAVIVGELETNDLVKLRDEVAQICTDARRLVQGLARLDGE